MLAAALDGVGASMRTPEGVECSDMLLSVKMVNTGSSYCLFFFLSFFCDVLVLGG